MALFDMPLDSLRDYRPQLSEPEDLMPFWDETLSRARASSPILSIEPVENGLTLIRTWDVTFAGHDGSPVRASNTSATAVAAASRSSAWHSRAPVTATW